ncbi:MAG: response regulator [Zetaproteobacteria bacterium]|nr:response regulator [Zetaproteobacteria bacterium]
MKFARQNTTANSFKTIRKKLLFSVLVISSIFTTIITTVDLYLQYKDQMNDIDKNVNHIHKSFANSLSYSLWHLDDQQVQFQLDGILTTSYFIETIIVDPKGKELYRKTKPNMHSGSKYSRTIPLYYQRGENLDHIGTLQILVSRKYIYQKLQSKVANTLIFQGIKVFIVSLILLQVFSKIVTKHLISINRYLRYFDWTFTKKHKKLKLKRRQHHEKDELDQLSDEINQSLEYARNNVNKINQLQMASDRSLERERQFILTMNHELRTPLNAILGMAEVLHSEYNTEETKKYLNLQLKAGKTLLSLIDSIQDFSKIDAGEVSLNNRRINLLNIIEETTSMLEKDAEKVGINISFFWDNNIPRELIGDGDKLRQILLSIMSNSIKYSEGSKISVIAILQEQEKGVFTVQITIDDDGIGLNQNEIDKIFEPFQRLRNENNPRTSGRGLGLYVTKSFVLLMGGKIELKSQPRVKTSFKMRIPFRQAKLESSLQVETEEQDIALKTSSLPEPEIPTGLVALAVDDNEDNLFLLKMILSKKGFTIATANDGLEALNYFKENHVDLVIMDIQMPVMDGFESTLRIREWEIANQRKEVPIIALTAGYAKDDSQSSEKNGFSAYLGKPIRKKVLFDTILKVLYPRKIS